MAVSRVGGLQGRPWLWLQQVESDDEKLKPNRQQGLNFSINIRC
jgi:hypothetical protein